MHQAINRYFKAWVHKDEEAFLSCIHKDFYCKECTGDVYEGIEVARDWFLGWHQGDNEVISWTIKQDWSVKDWTFITWVFVCRFEGAVYTFDGLSKVRIDKEQIIELEEYSQVHENNYPYGRKK